MRTAKAQFCDPDGYDIIPIRMITPVMGVKSKTRSQNEAYNMRADIVSVQELSNADYGSADEGDNDGCLDTSDEQDSDGDDIVPESKLEKVRLLLKEREVLLEMPNDKPKRKFCKSHRKVCKQAVKKKQQQRRQELEDVDKEHFIPPPDFSGKNEYLYYVGAEDGVKDEVLSALPPVSPYAGRDDAGELLTSLSLTSPPYAGRLGKGERIKAGTWAMAVHAYTHTHTQQQGCSC